MRRSKKWGCPRCGGPLRQKLTGASFYPPDEALALAVGGVANALLGYSMSLECEDCGHSPTSMGGMISLVPYTGSNKLISFTTENRG